MGIMFVVCIFSSYIFTDNNKNVTICFCLHKIKEIEKQQNHCMHPMKGEGEERAVKMRVKIILWMATDELRYLQKLLSNMMVVDTTGT